MTPALRIAGVYSWVDTRNRTPGAANFGNELARTPEHFGTLYADWTTPFAGLVLGADLRVVGDSFDDQGNAVRLDGYELLTLRASMPLGDRFALFGRIENVFDEEYRTVAGYGTAGRGVFAGVRAEY